MFSWIHQWGHLGQDFSLWRSCLTIKDILFLSGPLVASNLLVSRDSSAQWSSEGNSPAQKMLKPRHPFLGTKIIRIKNLGSNMTQLKMSERAYKNGSRKIRARTWDCGEYTAKTFSCSVILNQFWKSTHPSKMNIKWLWTRSPCHQPESHSGLMWGNECAGQFWEETEYGWRTLKGRQALDEICWLADCTTRKF